MFLLYDQEQLKELLLNIVLVFLVSAIIEIGK